MNAQWKLQPPSPPDTPMEDVEMTSSVASGKAKGPTAPGTVVSIDLTRSVDEVKLEELLVAGAATSLPSLPLNAKDLAKMHPTAIIQRLIWTSVSKWQDLKTLSKHNAGLRVAFSKDNAPLLCNFVIKTRYPEEARYLGLDLSDPLSTKWLIPSGSQVPSIINCEHKFRLEFTAEMKLEGTKDLYVPGVSFLEPGPALLYGLELGMVMIMRDPGSGRVAAALREDVARKCLEILTRPWFLKPKGYGTVILPRSESGAINWYYDQEGDRADIVDDILSRAESREALNFEDVR